MNNRKDKQIRISLKFKLTMLMSVLIIMVSVILTVSSINSAEEYFVKIADVESSNIESDDGIYIKQYEGTAKSKDNSTEMTSILGKDEKNVISEVGEVSFVVKESSKRFADISYIYMGIIITIGIGFTYVLIGKSLNPLKQLNDTVISINENNLSNHINDIKGNDEVSDLACSFNTMLDRLNESFFNQKQFVSNAAHELKTPLAIMKSSIDVLRLDEEPSIEEYKENLKYMEESTKNLMDIVESLLKLTSKAEINNNIIEVKSMLITILEELKPIADNKGIDIDFKMGEENLLGDEKLLYHVFFNLIENAIKYNNHNGKIIIRAFKDEKEINIVIRDTGIGIPKNELNNIFEPFYCVDKSRSEENGGYGLGLSLVKSIVEKHNGKIEVDSILNEGSKFSVKLPASV